MFLIQNMQAEWVKVLQSNNTMENQFVITLTKEEVDILLNELNSLYSYHWNSDHIHAGDCGSKILETIEVQLAYQGIK